MGRLCERPGCSDNAALAYGMRTEDLVFWVDVMREPSGDSGVLCQRHGDSMTVPRGWTLDDLRDPDLHLFRPPPRPDGPATRPSRAQRRPRSGDDTGQLALGVRVDDHHDEQDTAEASGDREVDDAAGRAVHDDVDVAPELAGEPRSGAVAWKPAFDGGDDLDGLLAATSPLLSRAFRGDRG